MELTVKPIRLRERTPYKTKSELTSTTLNLHQKQLVDERINGATPADSIKTFVGSTNSREDINSEDNQSEDGSVTPAVRFGLEKNGKIWRSRSVPSRSELTIDDNISPGHQLNLEADELAHDLMKPLSFLDHNELDLAEWHQSVDNLPSIEVLHRYRRQDPSYQLRKLRLTGLKLEEIYLLRMKNLIEMEVIREPKSHWYAIKGPSFHEECHRNGWHLANHRIATQLLNQRRKEINQLDRIAEYIHWLEDE